MSEYAIRLPDVGEGIAQAEVVQWHVAVGDHLAEDDPFVDVMTDKATVELPSPVAGTVLRLAAEIGDFVAVGAPLIVLDVGEAPASAAPSASGEQTAPARSETMPADRPSAAPAPEPLAAPAVRRRAADLGLDLGTIPGSGEDGRVVHRDLDAVLTRGGRQIRAMGSAEDVQSIRLTGLRRNIARRMQEAHKIPHFTYVESVDVGELERLRAALNDGSRDDRPRLTILPLLIRAVVVAAADHPEMNARFDADAGQVERYGAVHVGIATQTANGLMVPVLRHAENADLWATATEIRRLADAAANGTIALAELTGSTITITSLGALGGIVTTPVINAPEVAIIGVNRIVEQPTLADGTLRNRSVMNLSSSFDHRVVDGWNAARFIQRIKTLLETPALLFADS